MFIVQTPIKSSTSSKRLWRKVSNHRKTINAIIAAYKVLDTRGWVRIVDGQGKVLFRMVSKSGRRLLVRNPGKTIDMGPDYFARKAYASEDIKRVKKAAWEEAGQVITDEQAAFIAKRIKIKQLRSLLRIVS